MTWPLDVAKAALEHQEEILGLYKRFRARWLRRRQCIVITGVSGAGKTDLMHHLVGRGSDSAATKMSLTREHGRLVGPNRHFRLTVVPGAETLPDRARAIDAHLAGRKAPVGLVHVVCNGFVQIREGSARSALRSDNPAISDLHGFLEAARKRELAEFSRVLDAAYQSRALCGRPEWLCIGLTKVDLYAGETDRARDWHDPHGEQAYAAAVASAQERTGDARMRVFCVPICASLEPFHWGDTIVDSQGIPERTRNELVLSLRRRIAEESARGD